MTAGPSSQVCGPAVCYRRHHGAPHWLLSHQWGEDSLLHGQDHSEDDEKNQIKQVIYNLKVSIPND